MNSKRYRSLLAETTDEHLRYEFLKLIAQEGRQHYMLQIADPGIKAFAEIRSFCPKAAPQFNVNAVMRIIPRNRNIAAPPTPDCAVSLG